MGSLSHWVIEELCNRVIEISKWITSEQNKLPDYAITKLPNDTMTP